MSDHDRGAYTPQNDAPLSFDARQQRGRRAFPTTLVISLLILIGLGGAIFMFYRSGVRGAGEAPTPVGAPIDQIKAAPPANGSQQSADAAAGLQIYKSEGPPAAAPTTAPVFAAGPEQPQPRPAPTTPVAVAPVVTHAVPAPPLPPAASPSAVAASGATAKPATPAPIVIAEAKPAPAPVAAKPAPAAAAPVTAKAKPADAVGDLLKSPPAATKAVAPAPKPAVKPAPPAEAKAAPDSAAASHGAAVVQIGAYSSAALASKGWSDLAAAYASDMSGKGKLVESVDRDGKTLFRAAVSGFASRADAVAFCAKLKGDSRACIVR